MTQCDEDYYLYIQDTGTLALGKSGKVIGRGYAGKGSSKNNPSHEHIRNKGPIPKGKYAIGSHYTSKKCGVYSIKLTPIGHNAHGRTDFLIHGDNDYQTASEGCIVMTKNVRLKIIGGSIKKLEVIDKTYYSSSNQFGSWKKYKN